MKVSRNPSALLNALVEEEKDVSTDPDCRCARGSNKPSTPMIS